MKRYGLTACLLLACMALLTLLLKTFMEWRQRSLMQRSEAV